MRRLSVAVFSLAGLTALSACSTGPISSDYIYDPFEATNRQVHQFNKAIDQAALQPAANAYGAIPEEIRDIVDNSANNLALPGQAINHTLQGDLPNAVQTAIRFTLNSTIGIGGMFDPASELGLFEVSTDFGDTMHVWGFAEGPYVELPLIGGTTVRGTVGMVVDFAIDPIKQFVPASERRYLFILKGMDVVGDRHAYSDLVDVLLYESADSYAAQRISYLQNLRFKLDGGTSAGDFEDPFAFDY